MTNKQQRMACTRTPGRKSAPKAKLKTTKSVPVQATLPLCSGAEPQKTHNYNPTGRVSRLSTLFMRNRAQEVMNTSSTVLPGPYLEPIKSKQDQVTEVALSSPVPKPKQLLDASKRERRISRSHSDKVPRNARERGVVKRRELAYLIVDLRTGKPTYDYKRTSGPYHPSISEEEELSLPVRSKSMSVQRPVPVPRHRAANGHSRSSPPRPLPRHESLSPEHKPRDALKQNPTLSLQLSPSKPKPARPPPPNPQALQKARERRTTESNNHTVAARLRSRTVDTEHSLSRPDYEELDHDLDPDDIDTSMPSNPPPRLPPRQAGVSRTLSSSTFSSQSHRSSSGSVVSAVSNVSAASQSHRSSLGSVVSTVSNVSATLQSHRSSSGSEGYDRDDTYESIDASVPIPPPRLKKKSSLKAKPKDGTGRTGSFSHSQGRAPVVSGQGPKTDPLKRRRAPPPPPVASPLTSASTNIIKSVSVPSVYLEPKTISEISVSRPDYEDIDHDLDITDEQLLEQSSQNNPPRLPPPRIIENALPLPPKPKAGTFKVHRRGQITAPQPPTGASQSASTLPAQSRTVVNSDYETRYEDIDRDHDINDENALPPTAENLPPKPQSVQTSQVAQPQPCGEHASGGLNTSTSDLASAVNGVLESDVGGVDDYIEMNSIGGLEHRSEETPEEEDHPSETYVEMHPAGHFIEEPVYIEMNESEYIPPPAIYYASRDLLAERPDLKVTSKRHKAKKN